MFPSFSLVSHTEREAQERAGLLSSVVPGCLRKLAKEMPSARRKALLHTFVAGQKYSVRRDATRWFRLSEIQQRQQINHLLP